MIPSRTDKADADTRTRIEKAPQRLPFDIASLGTDPSAEANMLPALFSVVIPVYNSATVIAETVSQVRAFFLSQGHRYEIILVNDGSVDGSWNIVSGLAKSLPDVVGINLLKNYGQHNANLCGFREARGDYVITMDDDLQNPPVEIGKLIEAARQGHDLVIGRFESKRHPFMRRFGSRIVGWLNRKAFGVKEHLVLSNFRIIRRDVVNRVCLDKSVAPYIPGLVLKYSARRCNVPVQHNVRVHGTSTYTFRKLLSLVANILFNHSTLPLRFGAAFGFVVSGTSFLFGMFYLVRTTIWGSAVPGWATLVVLLSFFNGVLILLLSIIGEYLIRVLRELGSANSYIVNEVIRP